MSLQEFFESTLGQVATVGVIVLLFGAILISGKKKKVDTRGMVLSAIFVALFVVLNEITIFRMPQGGSITAFSMFTITYCAYLLGTRRAVMAGFCAGLITLIFNPFVVHPVQLLLDYPLASAALALGGFLSTRKYGIISGYVVGVFFRYLCSFLSGVIFFGSFAPEGWNSVLWSLFYNITYIGVEMVITVALLCIPPFRRALERLKKQVD